jgi:hypothetical protein
MLQAPRASVACQLCLFPSLQQCFPMPAEQPALAGGVLAAADLSVIHPFHHFWIGWILKCALMREKTKHLRS